MKASSSAEKDSFIQNKILFSAENGVKIPYQGFQSQKNLSKASWTWIPNETSKKNMSYTSHTRFENEPVISQKIIQCKRERKHVSSTPNLVSLHAIQYLLINTTNMDSENWIAKNITSRKISYTMCRRVIFCIKHMACADAEALLKVCRHRHPALIPGLKFEPRSSSEGLGLPSYSVLQ